MKENAVLGVENSLNSQFWSSKSVQPEMVEDIARKSGVTEVVARLLALRGVTPETVSFFLSPSFKQHLPDPYILKDMEKSATRLAKAITSGEKIGIFGDYDVDGATSSSILYRFLKATTDAEIKIRIPTRDEGYGPSIKGMTEFLDADISLVVTVDCGTTAFEALEFMTQQNKDVIIIDHHEPDTTLPKVFSVINPKRIEEARDNPCREMAAVGVVFMTLIAVNRLLRKQGFYENKPEPNLMDFLDLVSFGTVCDVVPLRGLNRLFVKSGLEVLAKNSNKGLAVLSELAKLKDKPTTYHLGFVFGPRLNACGRIGDSSLGAKLLCAQEEEEARQIASQLDSLNVERRQMCETILKEAIGQVESLETPEKIAFVYGTNWHSGVVGIIAGRLKERYKIPSLVMSLEDGELRGSGRSVKGLDLGSAILLAKEKGLLLTGGGHSMAAGFSLKEENAQAFKAFLIEYFETHQTQEEKQTDFEIDSVLDISGVSGDLLNILKTMEPFGEENLEPRFAIPDVSVSFARVVGTGHVSCTFVGRNGRSSLRAIAYRVADSLIGNMLLKNDGTLFHIAGTIRPDTYRGGNNVQFILEDIAVAS